MHLLTSDMMKQYQTGVSLPTVQYQNGYFWVLLFNFFFYPVIFSPFLYGNHHDRLVTPERPRSLCIACQLNDLFNLPSDIDAQSPPL